MKFQFLSGIFLIISGFLWGLMEHNMIELLLYGFGILLIYSYWITKEPKQQVTEIT